MSRFLLLAGSVLFVISSVNAGPCRPSSSVISSGIETAATSTEVVEPTATLASTLTTETEAFETLSIIVSTIEASTASEDTAVESATTTEGVTTTEATTAGAATTTEVATTTAETTTALPSTSAAPVLEPRRDCGSFSTQYTAPNGVVYNIRCSTDFEPASFSPAGFFEDVTSFGDCLSKCETSSGCNGVQWDNLNSYCVTMRSFGGTMQSPGNDIAFRIGVSPKGAAFTVATEPMSLDLLVHISCQD